MFGKIKLSNILLLFFLFFLSVSRSAQAQTASWYGAEYAGNHVACSNSRNPERFNPSALTAAHRTLPCGTRVRVTNVRTGRSVIVRINDRGPFVRGRVIDLSQEAFRRIAPLSQGVIPVEIERLD